MPIEIIRNFLTTTAQKCGPVYNERSLQLELGILFRNEEYNVEFERPVTIQSLPGSTKKPKRYLDILLDTGAHKVAIELKVPLAGRIPETMYDFCADVEFVESIIRSGMASYGICLLMTSDPLFWSASAVSNKIYDFFRVPGVPLVGEIKKPTGVETTILRLSGQYDAHGAWTNVLNTKLMNNARYLLIEIH